ncbi:hypothetical protein LAZ67_3001593 [Cordylochernes scorpioides]|uniref:Transposase n=1 Tax=Cordylochernes scorpioides TaxID=51811 RepID=A0ABY6KA03_9ARAC|nr:hypothetical protein LAZ67_3001593 [Cordylochernes scorpioides]
MDIKNVRKWCRELNEGRINVHDEQRSGWPSLRESTVARIDEMVRSNRRITLEEIEDGLNEDCSHFSVHKIVSETLGYRKVSVRNPEKVSQISNLIKENPRNRVTEIIEEETGISKSLVGSIIKEDLQLKKRPSKFVPKMLTIQQKENRDEVAKIMFEKVEENPNWKEKVITGDET